jgi:hypothetical protein
MTFKEYLARRRITDTPAGDFTADARSDGNLPNVTTWEELRSYLNGKSAYRGTFLVITPARKVWRDYERAQRKSA